jgi:transmembrane sensor
MPDPIRSSSKLDAIEESAGAWVLRLQTGLTPAQERELSDWLAADSRHSAAFMELQQAWDRLDPLEAQMAAGKPIPTVVAADARGHMLHSPLVRFWGPGLAAAAAVAIGILSWRQHHPAQVSVPNPVASAISLSQLPAPLQHHPAQVSVPNPAAPAISLSQLLGPCEERTLEDGSVVQLNHNAQISVHYTPAARIVELVHGEAHFKVAKNPSRPFVVKVGAVEVRAVGTAFDVRFDPALVEILVTEGRVRVERTAASLISAATPDSSALVSAGQNAAVSLTQTILSPKVTPVTATEMETRLAWRPQVLEYDDVPLSTIVAEFNRHNSVHLVVDDPKLGLLRMTVSFRSDNMEGFVRLIEINYGIRAESRGDRGIVLSRK